MIDDGKIGGVKRSFPLFLILIALTLNAFGQKKVKLEYADRLIGGKSRNQEYNSFAGNVHFSQKDINIFCDSAIFYKKDNNVEAFGNVKIYQGDSVLVTGNRAKYNGNNKVAQMRTNVVFTKLSEMTLYTENLDYDRNSELAYYFEGGKIVDSTNTLTSTRGYYHVPTHTASFKDSVRGESPDYLLESDTLQYNTKSKVIYFLSETKMQDRKGNVFNSASGYYDTQIDRSDFLAGNFESESYHLYGDKLFLDDAAGYYIADQNVKMVSKENDIIVLGNKAEYYKNEGVTKVFEDPLLKIIVKPDTIYLSADTLVAVDNDTLQYLQAYRNVKIFKDELQGRADSLVYNKADSILYMYHDPVLWTEGNQMTAEDIQIKINEGEIEKLNLFVNSFVINQDTLLNFNQVKGREMEATFEQNSLRSVYVEGNGESLFFMLNEEQTDFIGMNKIICSSIRLTFINNELENVVFYQDGEGSFIPPHELNEAQKKLSGFAWRIESKPTLENTIPEKYQWDGMVQEIEPIKTSEVPEQN